MITAQITGGLGNQLFTYTRLALHARQHNLNLVVDGSIPERVLGGPSDLFDFHLAKERRITLADYGNLKAQTERFLWKNEQLRKLTKRYQDSLLGSENSLSPYMNGWKVRGFFQDYSVASDFLNEFGRNPLCLIKESSELQQLTLEVNNCKSLAIHMRRGDYLNHRESFGVLEDSYYLNALEVMLKRVTLEKVFIFSDTPESVVNFQKKLKIDSEILLPSRLRTSETLILMSRCSSIITSNSTFSFWASMLANHQEVIYPQPWFRSSGEWLSSANLKNPNWNWVKSKWAN